MLRTAKKEINLNVSRCQIVNDGVPFLRITCETVLLSPDDRRFVLNNKSWHLDGAGGPIKQNGVSQFINRHHMPPATHGAIVEGVGENGAVLDQSGFATGVGYFTTDLVVDLFMPRGVIDIHFAKYNDEREAFERAKKEEAEKLRLEKEAAEKAVEEQRVKEEKRNAVDGLRRRFHNLDLEE